MRENPSVPAQTVLKHIQSSRNRVERIAKDAENFRTGLRALHRDAITLRNVLEDKPEELAKMEAGLMAISYKAADCLAGFDQLVRMELSLQAEAERWLHGKTPRLERGRPHLAFEPAKGEESPKKNGAVPALGGSYDYVKAEGQEVPTKQPDPSVAVGFYLDKDEQTGKERRIYVNAYDQVVPPPVVKEENVAISICGIGKDEAGRQVPTNGAPTLTEPAPAPPQDGGQS